TPNFFPPPHLLLLKSAILWYILIAEWLSYLSVNMEVFSFARSASYFTHIDHSDGDSRRRSKPCASAEGYL
ncbi:MAG: hypothetical protein Q7N50_03770, partial [Armatimonadota bacterium]|nr:hypothetical protein [Armatimonadota bacterium]